MNFNFHPITADDARAALQWRYEEPYTLYNPSGEDTAADVANFLDPSLNYSTILNEQGEMIGFYCLGEDATVAGGDYSEPALDIGIGLRPDLTGKGVGTAVLKAIMDEERREQQPQTFRATVAAFNSRAQQLCKSAGFHETQHFTRGEGADAMGFVVLERSAD